MSLVVPWLVFPLVLAALSLGCGLAVDKLSGTVLPGTLLLPVGFATIVVLADLTTSWPGTAKLAIPVVVGVAVVGFGLTWPWRWRIQRWTAGASVLVFLFYGAPVLLTGSATFAGYIKLDDGATWLALADNALVHGRSLAGLPGSTYSSLLYGYIHSGYPLGSMLPLGITAKLVGQDSLWAFQPYLAFQGLLLALCFQSMLGGIVKSTRISATVAFLAAQPSLLYGYAMWGAIKELVTVPLLALLAVLVQHVFRPQLTARSLLPLAINVAAVIAVLNVGGGVWVGIALVPTLALAVRIPLRTFLRLAVVFAAVTVLLSRPALQTENSFYSSGKGTLTAGTELGTLLHPLSWLQVFGIWLVGDFRAKPHDMDPTYILIGLLCLGAAWACFHALRRRQLALPLYVVISLVGCAILVKLGSPWVDAKALATASPAMLLAGLAGAAVAFEQGRRVEAAIAATAIAAGVLWSTALIYHEVWLAPRSQLVELQQIGKQFAGQGPALMTEFQPYGARHLLRNVPAEDASGVRANQDFLSNGQTVANGGFADLDDFALSTVLSYPLLVVDSSPVGSRPPSNYNLVWHGAFYDVWQRAAAAPQVIQHLSLGDDLQPVSIPKCSDVLQLAQVAAKAGGRLATVFRSPATVVGNLAGISHPPQWLIGTDGNVYPNHAGDLQVTVDLPRAGRYGVWLGGSFPGRLKVLVDGTSVGSATQRLQHPGQYLELGATDLPAGRHTVTIDYLGSDWRPGTGAHLLMSMGPIVLSTTTDDVAVRYFRPAAAKSLCGQSLDWVEAVAGS